MKIEERDREHWLRELAAAAPAKALAEQRAAFAIAVISSLPAAYARGRRAEDAWKIEQSFAEAATAVQVSLERLAALIAGDRVSAARVGLKLRDLQFVSAPLQEILNAAYNIADARSRRDRFPSRPRRGRKNRAAIEIAEMIAIEYDRHFGKPAGRSKQADKSNPFFRICKVVEQILRAAGCDISLGDDARREGIDRACEFALKEMIGLGPLDTYMVRDPRTLLLRKRDGDAALDMPEGGGILIRRSEPHHGVGGKGG